MDIFARIQEDRGQFSQSERRIADILVSDFEFAVNASIIELAARAEVSPPTVTRFCRRLGCQSFSDFKVSLAKTAYVGIRYLTSEPSSTGPSDV
ncbi:MurR/RpiR family transcriptional regulator, partial [Agrobacterium sp. S2]|nr:MurR/RpiR family transcriptional regulator [Agrobacterium sp. S2]MBM7330820.1 MurR/RpiR family transcriptional regulator [Agrobacterium sp. S2]